MSSRRAHSSYKRPQFRGGRGGWGDGGRGGKLRTVTAGSLLPTDGTSNNEKFEAERLVSRIDEAMGFPKYESGPKKVGWLVNMRTVLLVLRRHYREQDVGKHININTIDHPGGR